MVTFQNPGQALWDNRHSVAKVIPRLESFFDAISSQSNMDMLPEDYPKLFAAVLAFRPDYVVEVGRLNGNSTCILTEAVQGIEKATVLSICLTDHWFKRSLPKIGHLISPGWLGKLDARVINLTDLDVERTLGDKERVLFILDAHGWTVAEYTLGIVFPQLIRRKSLVLVHDIIIPAHWGELRTKYYPNDPKKSGKIDTYANKGIWKGDPKGDQFLFANDLAGSYPEFLAFVDFSERNKLKLQSVEEDIRREIHELPERRKEMVGLLGERMYSPFSAYAWMDLNRLANSSTLHFPKFEMPFSDSESQLVEQLRDDLKRHNRRGRPSFLTLGRILTKILLRRYPMT